jgi:hypothetical protein
MYTLRDLVAADYPGILRAMAELGYRAVEQDNCAWPPLESVGMRLAYLRSLGWAK